MKKRWISVLLLGTVVLGPITANAQEWPPKTLEPSTRLGGIPGNAVLAIEAAKHEIAKKNFDLSEYNIEVAEIGTFISVTLEDKTIRPECMNASGCRGSRGYKPSFSVILAKEGLRVITAHFVK
jgi:hypothetical protein